MDQVAWMCICSYASTTDYEKRQFNFHFIKIKPQNKKEHFIHILAHIWCSTKPKNSCSYAMHSNVHCRCSIVKPDRPTNKPPKLLCCFVSLPAIFPKFCNTEHQNAGIVVFILVSFLSIFFLLRSNSLNCHHHRPDGAIAECTQQICVFKANDKT